MWPIRETRLWKESFPDPEERAAAMELMDEQARAYDPVAAGCLPTAGGKLAVAIIDRSGIVGDAEMNIWASMGEVETEWADGADGLRSHPDRWHALQERDFAISEKASDAALELAAAMGLIYRLRDGSWEQAELCGVEGMPPRIIQRGYDGL